MTQQPKINTPDEPHERLAVLDAIPATAPGERAAGGAIAIFYGAARYPFELARQRELVEGYADATGLNLVTEFHDRQGRQYGLSMLLAACQRGGVEYVITAGCPTPNLTETEAEAVVEQLAASGTQLVCLNTWQPGDGEPPAWWDDEEGAWVRQLDALREQERRGREQTSQANRAGEGSNGSDDGETGEVSGVSASDASETDERRQPDETDAAEQSGETGQLSQNSEVIQAGEMRETGTDSEADNASDDTEAGAICASRDASRITETIEPSKEVHHA